jgi:hypothetical protein
MVGDNEKIMNDDKINGEQWEDVEWHWGKKSINKGMMRWCWVTLEILFSIDKVTTRQCWMTLGILFSTNRGMLDMRTMLKKCGVKHWATLRKCYVMSNMVIKIVVTLGKAKKTCGGGGCITLGRLWGTFGKLKKTMKDDRDIDKMLRIC